MQERDVIWHMRKELIERCLDSIPVKAGLANYRKENLFLELLKSITKIWGA